MSDLFKVGDILRYDSGSTALMKVTSVSVGHGGSKARYYGNQFFGSTVGAYHEDVVAATEEDLKRWAEKHGEEKR